MHNVHHASTNVEDEDPDLNIPLQNFTLKRFQSERGMWKLIRNYQAFIIFPLRTLAVYTVRISGFSYFRTQPRTVRVGIEIALWILAVGIWLALPFFIFSLAKAVFLFMFVNTLMGLYISNVFAPNHKGMPQVNQVHTSHFLNIKYSLLGILMVLFSMICFTLA